jgi:hypothetical protein
MLNSEQAAAAHALEGLRGIREERARDKAAEWAKAGLGFWRLVWIIAVGILVAQAISGAILGIWSLLAQ